MKPEDIYHTGIVVDDLDATLPGPRLPSVARFEWIEPPPAHSVRAGRHPSPNRRVVDT
jgi:hypothetical protein